MTMEHVVIHDPDNGIPDETHVYRGSKYSIPVCASRFGVSLDAGGDNLCWFDGETVSNLLLESSSALAIAYRKHLELRDG